jgi:hypothetical protein
MVPPCPLPAVGRPYAHGRRRKAEAAENLQGLKGKACKACMGKGGAHIGGRQPGSADAKD